jgi:hypothetical protein
LPEQSKGLSSLIGAQRGADHIAATWREVLVFKSPIAVGDICQNVKDTQHAGRMLVVAKQRKALLKELTGLPILALVICCNAFLVECISLATKWCRRLRVSRGHSFLLNIQQLILLPMAPPPLEPSAEEVVGGHFLAHRPQ